MERNLRTTVRLTLQGTAAAGTTYLLCHALGVSEISWAVISALFVVQQSFDETLASAAGRLGSTVIGTAVGMASVYLLGGEELTLWRIVIAAVVLNAIASLRPELRYGVVAATIIALDTDPYVWGGALDRGAAILLGTAAGAIVGLVVWPQSAAGCAVRAVRAGLGDCRDLLRAELTELVDHREQQLAPIHDRFLGHLRKARSMTTAAHMKRTINGVPLTRLVHALSRLWHSLVVIDRIISDDHRPEVTQHPPLIAHVHDFRAAACEYLERRSDSGGARAPALDRLGDAIENACSAIRTSTGMRPLEPLAFGLRELGRNLREMDEMLCKLGGGAGNRRSFDRPSGPRWVKRRL